MIIIDGKKLPGDFSARKFYDTLAKVTGLRLHKDFNCRIVFEGDQAKELRVKPAAGIIIDRVDVETAAGVKKSKPKSKAKGFLVVATNKLIEILLELAMVVVIALHWILFG